MPSSSAVRRSALRAKLADLGADAALVTRLVNVRYLTGFTGSNAALLISADGAEVLATDGRYRTQSAAQAPDLERVIERQCANALVNRAAALGVRRLALETHEVTVDLHATLRDVLAEAAPTAELCSLRAGVEALRTVKDDEEIALLREACAIGDRALADLLAAGGLRPGRSERQVARDLEGRMLDHGGDGPAFESIVASGPHSAIPHHRPTDRELAAGDFVKLDFGALYRGYHADMTRTFVLGQPADWQQEIYGIVAEAQRLGREALGVGVPAAAVDEVARDHIAAAGYGETYTHGLGHGVGLEIHEAPSLGRGAPGTLDDRVPVTVEPGIYLEGRGGVRIEDTLVVRAAGPELLTTTTKDLVSL